MIFVFDLEGPLSPMDHAADCMKLIGENLGRDDFFDLFGMLSLYDDELTLEGKPGYNPGDTLRLIAPIVSTHLSREEMIGISETATLTPGAKDLMARLDLDNVYVASTSYSEHAHTIARRLGIYPENVNCTKLPDFKSFPYMEDLENIFAKYKDTGSEISAVKADLDSFFWSRLPSEYLTTKVCGGARKLDVVKRLVEERREPSSNFVCVGDSITDINMLEGVAEAGGLAISFNGNGYSAPVANLCVSSKSLMAIYPLVEADDPWKIVSDWREIQDRLKLLTPKTREYFRDKGILPSYDEVRKSYLTGAYPKEEVRKSYLCEVVVRQKTARKEMRKQYGDLT